MNKKDLFVLIALAALVGVVMGATLFAFQSLATPPTIQQPVLGGSIDVPGFTSIGAAGSSTSILVTTSSTQVLATSTGRSLAILVPQVPMYCNLNNGAPAALYSGIYVASGTPLTLNLNEDSLYRGTINCIAPVQGSTTVYAH